MAHRELITGVYKDDTANGPMSEELDAANDTNSVEATTPADCAPWLPFQLRTPSVSGARGDVKFAFFAGKRRLLVERAGVMVLYDCGDHRDGSQAAVHNPSHRMRFGSAIAHQGPNFGQQIGIWAAIPRDWERRMCGSELISKPEGRSRAR